MSAVSGLAIVELGQAVAKGEPQAEQTGDQDSEAGGHENVVHILFLPGSAGPRFQEHTGLDDMLGMSSTRPASLILRAGCAALRVAH